MLVNYSDDGLLMWGLASWICAEGEVLHCFEADHAYHCHAGKTVSKRKSDNGDICTHNNPTLNIDKILNFFSNDNLNFQIVGRGSNSTTISANIFKLEFAHPCALILEHLPSCSPSQYVQPKLTGQHLNTQAQNRQKTAAEDRASPILMFRLMV